jgi:tripartite-type tricarboxylate transporter receptor subunit TctC
MANINIIHIPYKGPAAAVTDLLAGQVQMYFENIGLMLPHIEAGKLRPLAVADDARSLQLPNVPTMVESGWPKLKARYWSAILAPAGTPTSIVNRLNTEINATSNSRCRLKFIEFCG